MWRRTVTPLSGEAPVWNVWNVMSFTNTVVMINDPMLRVCVNDSIISVQKLEPLTVEVWYDVMSCGQCAPCDFCREVEIILISM